MLWTRFSVGDVIDIAVEVTNTGARAGSAVVQCYVEKPPMNAQGALDLAKEQYAYCYDIVEQGTETIPALASELLKSKIWFFWWD